MFLRIFILSCALAIFTQSANAGPNCKCRFNGSMYKLGEIACIRGKLAQCELNLNNTSWKIVGEVCPQVLNMTPIPKPYDTAQAVLMSPVKR